MHEHQWEIDCDSEQSSHVLRGKIARKNTLIHSKPLLLLEMRDGLVKKTKTKSIWGGKVSKVIMEYKTAISEM